MVLDKNKLKMGYEHEKTFTKFQVGVIVVMRWKPSRSVALAINVSVVGNLKTIDSKILEVERVCSMITGEAIIRQALTYNKADDMVDVSVGLENGNRVLEVEARYRFVMLKIIYSHWKYVFQYFISKEVIDEENVKSILL